MRRRALRAFTAPVIVAAFVPALPSAAARAQATVVYPGMEILQDNRLCTLGYVDPMMRVAYTAGHCRGGGAVYDKSGNAIGRMATFRDNTPSGTTVATDQIINDYEAIVLDDGVTPSTFLPGGRPLQSNPAVTLQAGQPVCHFGVATGETCGIVESVNNGWFTMSHGVQSRRGDSGGPVYVAPDGGPGQIVGIFNSMWGDFPAAVSWRAASEQVRQDLGATADPS
ncbi:hypothetical protein [Mycobacterium sp. Lab-001]|uniref:Rv1815 family serine proteinase n=1 Tax=Mycobacterium sp. Lab-001 TaxID=3410136 RepID=UPI003D172085